jgi:hypothetical protein
MGTNGDHEYDPGKIIVYLGPSLSLARAREILPSAIYLPPAKQGDIVTDVTNHNPNTVILIDGCFHENLSVWHKEITWALQFPNLRRFYGAASMGALRASELDWLGMIGIGQIYQLYRDSVTEDDSEVALSYAEREGPEGPLYYPQTVPLVDIRVGVEHYEREFPGQPVALEARDFLEEMRAVYYADRTQALCEKGWAHRFGVTFPLIPQKAIDATHALNDFRKYQPEPIIKPAPENLSRFFHALYERDRRIEINGTAIPQQHIDAYVLLHNPEYERICWDSSNQELALMFCDHLLVTVSIEEIERENIRFQGRSGIETAADFSAYLSANGWTRSEYDRLMIQNARIRKLQHANTVAKMYRRNSQQIIDYLRTHQGFDYWAVQAVQLEEKIKQSGVDDWLGVNLETPTVTLLAQYLEKEGLEFKCNIEEYLLETGFSNLTELGVALSRVMAGKEL